MLPTRTPQPGALGRSRWHTLPEPWEGASGNARQLFYGLPKATCQVTSGVTSGILVGCTPPVPTALVGRNRWCRLLPRKPAPCTPNNLLFDELGGSSFTSTQVLPCSLQKQLAKHPSGIDSSPWPPHITFLHGNHRPQHPPQPGTGPSFVSMCFT